MPTKVQPWGRTNRTTTVTRMTVPNGFLESGTPHKWEVLAIERSGNQTLSSGAFRTQ